MSDGAQEHATGTFHKDQIAQTEGNKSIVKS